MFLELANGSRRGPRRIRGRDELRGPRRNGIVAGAAVVVDRDGRQHDGDGGRRRGGAGQRACALRSEQSMLKTFWLNGIRPPDAMSVADATMNGPVPRSRSPKVAPLNRISSYSSAASSDRPQSRRREVAPVRRIESARDELALDVALEKALLVVVEQLVAVQAVGQRGEAAARYAGDHARRRRAGEPSCRLAQSTSVRRRNSRTP